MKLKEQLAQLITLKHRLAVWEATSSLTDDAFLSKDGRKAGRAIRVPDCPTELVSETVIEDVLREIAEGPMADLKRKIDMIEDQEVTVIGDINEQSTATKN